jgi:hypothetical protein
MSKILKSWAIVEEETKLYEEILKKAGWLIVRLPDSPTVYLCHEYTGRIVEIDFEQFEGRTGLDIFDEFMTREKAQ